MSESMEIIMDHGNEPEKQTENVEEPNIFLFLQRECKIQLPNYLEKLLSYSGFDNIHSIANIEENTIDDIENFARTDLFDVAEENEIKNIYSGVYKNNFLNKITENKFKILPGHRTLLKELAKYCFKEKSNLEAVLTRNLRGLKRCRCSCTCDFASNMSKKNKVSITSKEINFKQPESTNEIEKAINHVKQLAVSYVRSLATKKEFAHDVNYDNVKLKYENHKSIKIQCFFGNCKVMSSISAVPLKLGSVKWILSNFNRHISKFHLKDSTGKSIKISTNKTSTNTENTAQQRSLLSYISTRSEQGCENNSKNNSEHTSHINQDLDITSINTSANLTTVGNKSNICEKTVDSVSVMMSPSDTSLDSVMNNECLDECLLNNTLDNTLMIEPDSEPFFDNSGSVTETSTSASSSALSNKSQNKWSDERYSRRQRQLRRFSALDITQTKLTDFYGVVKELQNCYENLIADPENSTTFTNENNLENTYQLETQENTVNPIEFRGLMDFLLEATKNNSGRSKFSNKYTKDFKQLALFIFLHSGRMLYEILQANMKNTLPSLSTLYRTLDQNSKLEEGKLRFEEMTSFLKKRKLPLKIFVSEDQTALVKRVQYDSASNKMIGFVLPLNNKTGIPFCTKFKVNSVKDIEDAFKNETMCGYANVIMAQPLDDTAPAFCLGLYGTDNKFSASDVINRWVYIEKEASKYGVKIEGFATDGDTRCLKAMKILSKLPLVSDNIYSPYFQIEYNLERPVCFQDTVHICTKLKTRFTKPGINLQMGSENVSVAHVEILLDTYSKDKHQLTPNYLNNADKMNFKAIDMISAPEVIELLKNIPNSKATQTFLCLIRHIINAFLKKDTDSNDRVYQIWYTIFVLRIWRQWLTVKKYSIQENFITLNAYTCIELNGHSLLLLLDRCREENTPENFLPWLYSSQPCEQIFRQTRSMTSTYSTIVNFSLYEIMKRLNRIQSLNDFNADFREKIHFPRDEGRLGKSKMHKVSAIPSIEEIKNILEKARSDALTDTANLGMDLNGTEDMHLIIGIPVSGNSLTDNEVRDDLENDKIPDEDDHQDDHLTKNLSENDTYISDTEIADIEKDLSLFNTFDDLKLKDYSTESKANETPYLKVVLNNKKTCTVRKSALCWFFSGQCGRLSSDRLLRVRGMNEKNNKRRAPIGIKKRKCRPKKIVTEIESRSSDTDLDTDDYSVKSDTNSEHLEETDEELPAIFLPEIEKYYAVFYDSTWYIGRVIEILEENCKMKFLEQFLDSFRWPKKDDIQTLNQKFLFYGPIKLQGAHPFSLNRSDLISIKSKYKELKSELNS